MSEDLEKRITEWAVWYHEHELTVRHSDDLKNITQFQMKAIDGLLECLAIATKDIQALEHRNTPLMLPIGIDFHGSLKKFGL